jgi:hypothetical protein
MGVFRRLKRKPNPSRYFAGISHRHRSAHTPAHGEPKVSLVHGAHIRNILDLAADRGGLGKGMAETTRKHTFRDSSDRKLLPIPPNIPAQSSGNLEKEKEPQKFARKTFDYVPVDFWHESQAKGRY